MKRRYLQNGGPHWWLVLRTKPKRTKPLVAANLLLREEEVIVNEGRAALRPAGRFRLFSHTPLRRVAAITVSHSELKSRLQEWLDWLGENDLRWSLDFESEVERRNLKSVTAKFSFETDRDAVQFMLGAV